MSLPPEPQPMRQRAPRADSGPLPFKEAEDAKLDDVMMAMDVVDTLRHERQLIVRDVNSEVRKQSLVDRLRDIYRGQGIEVPDDILLDGVKALEEERFRYQPPAPGFGTRLALLYVNRRRWLPWLWAALGLATLGAAGVIANAVEAERDTARIERLQTELPGQLDAALASALAASEDGDATARIEAIGAQAERALAGGDVVAASGLIDSLEEIETRLELAYDLVVVDRAGEQTGVTRDYRDPGAPPGLAATKYYVLVDALGVDGRPVSIPVTSSETDTTRDVSTFGVEVTRSLFDSVRTDKLADGDVDARDLGGKPAGRLDAEFAREGVLSGRITEW